MYPFEFCLANHINGDSSLTLRFYVFCQKAMCEPCNDSHKNTCEQQSHLEGRESETTNTSMPSRKRAKLSGAAKPNDAMNTSLKLRTDGTQRDKYPDCPMHHMPKEFFRCSHCKIICEQFHEEKKSFFFCFFLYILLHQFSRCMSMCTLYTPVLQDESLQVVMWPNHAKI